MKLLKSGQAGGLTAFILSIVTVAIMLAIGLVLLNEMKTASTSDGTATGTATAASNATGVVIAKMATVPVWIGIIIVVSMAFIVISLFAGSRR